MTDPEEQQPRRGVRRSTLVVVLAGACIVAVGSAAIVAAYASATASEQARRVEALTEKIGELAGDQKALSAQLDLLRSRPPATPSPSPSASPAAAGSDSVVPFTVSAAEADLGVCVAVARFRGAGDEERAGWPVELSYGSYLDGAVAFSVASSNGDVFQGTYYVDPTGVTARGILLRHAPVVVYGWKNGDADAATRISATALAHALQTPGAAGGRRRQAWFWIKLSPRGDVLAATETPPQ